MSKRITKLTAEQEARFPEFVRKWIDIGLSTAPADRPRAEAAIAGLSRLAKLKEPRVIWLPCPMSARLSAVCYAAIIQHRLVKRVTNQKDAVDGAVDAAVDGAVDGAVRGAVDAAVDGAVDDAVRGAVDAAVRGAVGGAVRDAVDAAVGGAVDDAVRGAVDAAVRGAVGGAVRDAVDGAVGGAVYGAVDAAVDAAVDDAVRGAVDAAVRGAVGGAVRDAVDAAVGGAVDDAVRGAVDAAVRGAVGGAVGAAVRGAVDDAVGGAVYGAVRAAVRGAVDGAVYGAVRDAVGDAARAYFGGSIWNAGYSAWADYFNEVCGIAIDRNFLDMTENCGFYWRLDGICFASERPAEIHLDQEGRLHCETGMSIRYAGTGWGLFHWHGTKVPADWIIDRDNLKPAHVLKTENLEQRRAGCEMLGWSRILAGLNARTIDRDGDPEIGELVEVNLPDLAQPAKFLRVRCGTGREFAIGIPPHITKALDAQAWCIGLEPNQFMRPEIRT